MSDLILEKDKFLLVMKKDYTALYFILMLLLVFGVQSANAQKVDYWRSDSVKVIRLLREAPKMTSMGDQIVYFARKLLGLPYVAKTLEKNKEEQLVVNLRQLDCTTFLESVLSLARTRQQERKTFESYCDNLRHIRYRGGRVNYVDRLHYFAYWIGCNEREGIVKSIQRPNPPFRAVLNWPVNYMTTHRNLYPMLKIHPEWTDDIRRMEDSVPRLRLRYIPKSEVANTKLLRSVIQNGDIIAIVTNKRGLDTSHVAFAVWHKDGLHIIHASSSAKRVIEDPSTLYRYLARHKSQTGIMVARAIN
jgi:hypothetical protein